MEHNQDLPQALSVPKLADALADLLKQPADAPGMSPNAYRLAFADPEFLLRRETRGMRLQLEMLKPDLNQREQGVDQTVVVFGSARFPSPETAQTSMQAAQASGNPAAIKLAERHLRNARYYDQARLFARLVAEYSEGMHAKDKLHICTGGGPGIMEAANRGAHELGAPTVGLNIALPHEQSANPYVTPALSFKFHYFALRKMHFMMRAKALVAFPGGFGTLDELFEVMTLVQTRKSQPVPIVLFGSEYWDRLLNMEVMVEEGVISPEDMDLFHLVDTPDAAWEVIRRFYAL
ncbi:TIGR00730 family Rossman fold protein [Rhodoferax antarcticus]|uniref:Cytokinin riboside 5'-monophosphate phosphoribohydrolase n=1 Tax=Rhodoferax antarcticus ANT.BR TaxID=1111071 RepID=A0A1Q8YBR5_9BURK|nr:TIGR00730 family Rossman fold protein [Rhodoferax antarcticus]APW46899.1 Rossman fold protein, TIGR00730 family [Rhodoferax antarcticus]OLP05425.1 putative lysine decarboxylase family protein [Rhodoferax antarcticus ANT.BR]